MAKRFLSLFLMLFILLPAAACGEEKAAPKQLTNAEGFVYTLTGNGSAQITGYTGKKEKLEIPDTLDGHPVTAIVERAFFHAGITGVTVPEGVRSVGSGAFEHCYSLKTVRLPEGLEFLGSDVFHSCTHLTTVNFPDSLKFVGDSIFSDCREIASITLSPDHPLLELADGVLFNRQAKRLLWYDPAKKDETYAIPEGTLSIGSQAFFGATPTAITVPDSVEEIARYAFSSCLNLKKINIPAKVTELNAVFPGRGTLVDIQVSPDNPVFYIQDGVLFDREKKALVIYPGGREDERYEIPDGTLAIASEAFMRAKLSEIVIPGSVKVIGSNTFLFCDRLTSITIPEGVEEIKGLAFQSCAGLKEIRLPRSLVKVGENPIRQCVNLRKIIVSEGHPALAVMDDALVSLEDMRLIWYPPAADRKKYTVPQGIRIIDCYAFAFNDQLTEITLPEGVEELRENVFDYCSNLKRVVLPKSLKEINRTAFHSGKSRKDMTPITYAVVKGSYAENFCKSYNLKIQYHK